MVRGSREEKMDKAKIFSLSKGFRGRSNNCYRIAKQAVDRALTNAYKGRREKKRFMRRAWITQINSAVRQYGLTYSRFQQGLVESNVRLDRKTLANLAVSEPYTFAALAKYTRERLLAANVPLAPLPKADTGKLVDFNTQL